MKSITFVDVVDGRDLIEDQDLLIQKKAKSTRVKIIEQGLANYSPWAAWFCIVCKLAMFF